MTQRRFEGRNLAPRKNAEAAKGSEQNCSSPFPFEKNAAEQNTKFVPSKKNRATICRRFFPYLTDCGDPTRRMTKFP